MMQDDIAHNYMNPHPGKVFNKPNGPDVYKGVPLVRPLGISHNSSFFVDNNEEIFRPGIEILIHAAPQDYTGEAVNARNFLQVLAGKKVRTQTSMLCSSQRCVSGKMSKCGQARHVRYHGVSKVKRVLCRRPRSSVHLARS